MFLVRFIDSLEVPLGTNACRGRGMLDHASHGSDGWVVAIGGRLRTSEHGAVSVGDVSRFIPDLFHSLRRVDLGGGMGRCDRGSDVGPQHKTSRNLLGFKHSSLFPHCRLGRARFTVPVTFDISPRALTRRSGGSHRDLDPVARRTLMTCSSVGE